jgi:hypothetical protein
MSFAELENCFIEFGPRLLCPRLELPDDGFVNLDGKVDISSDVIKSYRRHLVAISAAIVNGPFGHHAELTFCDVVHVFG